MKWKKYTIHTTTEAEDLVSMMLMEQGVEGVQIEDNVPLSDADTKGMFIDILPELAPDDGSSRLSFFLHLEDEEKNEQAYEREEEKCIAKACENNKISQKAETCKNDRSGEDNSYSIADRIWRKEEIAELLKNIRTELENMREYTDIGEGRIEEGVTEDTDWRDNWKKYFKPIKAGGFLIKPTWENVPEEYKKASEAGELKLIEIDPGTAFGTGSHETTQLCLSSIEKYIKKDDAVLDIGTGSGILGIAAIKEGAALVTATELDEQCEPSIRDNLSFNGISEEKFKLYIGNVIGDETTINAIHRRCSSYDVVIANILAPVICMLAAEGVADSFIKKEGIFITSGIIDEKLCEVEAAFSKNPNWSILEIREQGEWRSVVAKRM